MTLERVLLAGGGTAGHVLPLLATVQEITDRHTEAVITVVGSPDGIEERLVPEHGFTLSYVPKVAFTRRPNVAALRFPAAFRGALRQAEALVAERRPQVVVGFGGYVSTPVYLAARKAGIPIVIHEQNARPGLANKLGVRWAAHTATTFPGTPLAGAEVVGMPLRREIRELRPAMLRAEAMTYFGLDPGRPTLVITGGSLGAASLNEAFAAAAPALREAGVQVLHITGRGKGFEAPAAASGPRYVVEEYCDRMDLAYAVADLVVTRSGAGMVSELSTLAIPAIYVPLPIGNGEQRLNATDVVEAGGALLVDNGDVDATWVGRVVIPLVTDADELARMRAAAGSRGHADGAARLVDLIEDAAATGGRA